MKKKKRAIKFNKKERFIYTLGILSFTALFATTIFFETQISNLKMDIEKINYEIEQVEQYLYFKYRHKWRIYHEKLLSWK